MRRVCAFLLHSLDEELRVGWRLCKRLLEEGFGDSRGGLKKYMVCKEGSRERLINGLKFFKMCILNNTYSSLVQFVSLWLFGVSTKPRTISECFAFYYKEVLI